MYQNPTGKTIGIKFCFLIAVDIDVNWYNFYVKICMSIILHMYNNLVRR